VRVASGRREPGREERKSLVSYFFSSAFIFS
jgi:hypothetical protein